MKIHLLTAVLGLSALSSHANVVITEYVEGGSFNKAIEISNLGTENVNLAEKGYKLALYTNGKTDIQSELLLEGLLIPGSSIVVYNDAATDAFKKDAPQGIEDTATTSFNGDDAIILSNADGVVDSFGQLGTDPGSSWGTGDFTTANHTLRRLTSVIEGDTTTDDAFDPATQWATFAKDTADGLGCTGEAACDGSQPLPTEAGSSGDQGIVVITEYIEGGSFNKAVEISNLGTADVDLAVEGYKLNLFANGSTDSTSELLLQGLLIPGSSIVVYNEAATDAFKKDAPQGIEGTDATSFNGDDAITLSNADGVVDSFGQVGTRPDGSWGTGDFTTKDHTLRRLASVTEGDTTIDDSFDPATQWATFAKDTADGLGCNGEALCDGSQPLPTEGTAISGGGGSTPSDELCTNCPDLAKISDRATYVEATYYITANAAETAALRAAITTDISANHKQLTYSEAWTALTFSDEDPTNSNNIILLYSGRSIAKADNGSGSASSNQNFWNREHTWAKSHGFPETNQLGYTDIHHLRPADVSMNSDRGNRDFDIGGTPNTEAPENRSTTDTWEPRDDVKGDVARMMFYMDVRYDAGTESTMPDLVLVDTVGTATSTLSDGTGELGKLCTLFDWHSQDPVDTFETNRNNSIYEFQGNRNPFIDHPEWVDSLYASACGGSTGGGNGGDANEAPTVSAGEAQSVASAANVTLTATANDSDGTIASYAWTQISGKSATLVNANSATVTFVAPKVGADESLVFNVTVTDDQGKTSMASVTVNVAAEVIKQTESSGGTFYFLLAGLALFSLRRAKR